MDKTFRYQWHKYDIELVEVYTKYQEYMTNANDKNTWRGLAKEEFVSRQNYLFKSLFYHHKINIEKLQKDFAKVIIKADHSQYILFLSLKLITCDKYQIGRILDYQKENFNKNFPDKNGEFWEYAEHGIADQFRYNSIVVDESKLDKVIEWAGQQDEKEKEKEINEDTESQNSPPENIREAGKTIKQPSSKRVKKKATQKKPFKKSVRFSKDFISTVLPEFEIHFEKSKAKTLKALIIKGKAPVKRLVFNGAANRLVEFLKRARYNEKLVCPLNDDLANWIYLCFEHLEVKTHKPKRFSQKLILDILKNASKESNRRILEEVLPFISPSKRKK